MAAHKWTFKAFLYRVLTFRGFKDKEIKAEAEARSVECRQEQAKTRQIEHEFKMVKERDKQRALLEEIDYYKHKDDEPEPEQNQLAQLIPLIMMLKNAQSPEDMLPLLTGQNTFTQTQPVAKSFNSTTPQVKVISLSDEQIKAELSTVPKKYLKIAKTLSPEMCKAYAHRHFDFDEPTIERAIEIIRGE